MSFDCEATEKMLFAQEDCNGVTRTLTVEREWLTLDEVAEVFTDFLVACGYDYVTGMEFHTDSGVSHGFDKEETY